MKMDPLLLLLLAAATVVLTIFNYYLNYAPGTTPDDYAFGPEGASVQCDCCLNTIIIGAIAVGALAVSSGYFDSRIELYAVAIVVFAVVTTAGFLGRRRRYREWNEAIDLLERILPDGTMTPKKEDGPPDDDFNDY